MQQDAIEHPSESSPVAYQARVDTNRRVSPRRALPGTRAMVGALLVTMAAIVAFIAVQPHSAPRKRFVVARHALRSGQHLTEADLTTAPADLPPPLERRAFTSARQLSGAVLVGPVAAGEMLQQGQVAIASHQPARNEVSFAIAADRAVGGDLHPGDRIALLSAAGSDARPAVLAADLEVLAVSRRSGAIEGSNRLTVLVAAGPDQAMGVARALNPDLLTAVRTTGVQGSERIQTGDAGRS